jgi:hypothetical protein
MYHRTYDAPEGCVLVLGCTLGPDEVSFADVGHPFVVQNTKVPVVLTKGGRTVIPSGHIRQKLSFTTVSFGIPLFDSSIFSRSEGVSHFTVSCRVPYRLLCQVQVLYILEFGCNFIPYSLEAFLVILEPLAVPIPNGSVANIGDEHRCVLLIRFRKYVGYDPVFVREGPSDPSPVVLRFRKYVGYDPVFVREGPSDPSPVVRLLL